MSRRKQDRPQHLATANVDDPASEMSSHDVMGRIERSTVSEALGSGETSPGTGPSETEKTSSEVSLDSQTPRNEDLQPCDSEDTLPGENSFGSPKSDDDSLKCQTELNVSRCTFDLPLNVKDPKLGKQSRNKTPFAQSRNPVFEVERDSEGNAGLHLVDSRGTDSWGGGDQLTVGESHTSATSSRPSNSGYGAIVAESHVTKLQSFVDSLAKLTEPSYVARSQHPFQPQYPKITPTKASGCIGSYSGGSFHSGFPYYGYQSPADERGLATTPKAFLSPLEQPLDLSTKKHAGFANEESHGDRSSDLGSPEVRKRCLERSERLQAELFRQRPSYDAGNRSTTSRPVLSELDRVTSPRSVSFTAGHPARVLPQEKHRSSDGGKYKRERTVSSFGESAASKAAQTYTKSENVYRKETKQPHQSTDDIRRSSVAGKRKYSTVDEGSVHDGAEHSPGSQTIQKCQRQSMRCSGDSSHERGEALMPRQKEDREYMNMKCSCGTRFESLYQLAIHIERSGHMPGSLRPESLADLPKLVRGQDVWMSQGPEQAEMILRCVQCRTSFSSLPELTVHMIRTKHYVNIVGTDGSAGQMDHGDPPRERESPQRGTLKDSKRKNDAYTVREVSERSVEMVQHRLQKNKSPRHSNETTDTSVGMSQIHSAYSGRSQVNLQSSFNGRGSMEVVSEVKQETDECQENDANRRQSPVAREEISEKEPLDRTATVELDEPKEGSRKDIRGDQSLRRHSLASKLHSKISSVTSNIPERISSNQSANSAYTTGTRPLHSVSQGNSRNKTRVLKDACGVPEKVSDPGVARSSAEKHSSTGILSIQSPDGKDAVKSFESTSCGVSGAKENDGNRRNKRPRDPDYETENDRTREKKSKSQSGLWKPGHQLSKDPNSSRCLITERQPEMGPSTQDLRKERMLLNVSRWIASTELETKRDCGQTQIEDLDPIDNHRLELVSPPPQPVETSSILVAIKNFVDSSFCGQTFVSGSHQPNQAIFPSSSLPGMDPVPTGRNFPEMNYTLNLTPGASDTCESPSLSPPMKRKPHVDVHATDPSEKKRMRPASEEQIGRCSDADDSSCKQPLTVALRDVSKVNTQQNCEDDPEVPSIRDLTASPLWNLKSECSDSINQKCLEGSAPQSESLSGSEVEVDRQSTGGLRNGVAAVQPAPFPESKPTDDSSNTVDLEECSPAAQRVHTISIGVDKMDNLAVDSTTKSPKPSSPSPVGIVSTAYPLPDDPLRDRKSISKPISFFLSSRSFEKVC